MKGDIATAMLVFHARRPLVSGALFLCLFALALASASGLRVETSQLDLLPGDIPPVQDARRLDRLTGGAGYLVIALRPARVTPADENIRAAAWARLTGDDAESERLVGLARAEYARGGEALEREARLLNDAATALAERLRHLPRVRDVRFHRDTSFVRRKLAYFITTDDLREVLRRLSRKREELLDRFDPFYIELERRPYRLDLADIVAKYAAGGNQLSADDTFLAPDGRMIMLLVKPDFPLDDVELARDFLEETRALTNATLLSLDAMPDAGRGTGTNANEHEYELDFTTPRVTAAFTGTYAYYVEAIEAMRASLRPAMLSALLGIALVLLLFLRRPMLVLILILSLVYSVVLTFGASALIIGRLNLFTALFGGVLAGLGVDFGIHLLFRFLEEHPGTDPVTALSRAMRTTGRAVLFSALTTAAAFTVLIFTDFAGFRELGIIATIGIVLTVATMFAFMPYLILLYLRVRPGAWRSTGANRTGRDAARQQDESADEQRDVLPSRRSPGQLRLARVILVLAVPVFGFLGYHATGAGFDQDARNMLETDLESIRLNIEIDLRYDVSGDPLVVMSSGETEARQVFHHLTELARREPLISRVVSVFQLVPDPERQAVHHALLQRFLRESSALVRALPPGSSLKLPAEFNRYRSLLGESPFGVRDLPPELLDEFRVMDGDQEVFLTLIYPNRGRMYRTEQILRLERLIGDFTYPLADGEAGRARTTGSVILLARFVDMIQAELPLILYGTVALIVLCLWLSFRDARSMLLCLVPLVAGVLAMVGMLGLLDWRVNFFSVAVFPVIIGYGIDNGILLYHRFQETGSASTALRATAPAILASGLTTLIGWGSLFVASHPGIRSMGLVAGTGIVSMVPVALVLFPAVLRIVEERAGRTREARSSSDDL